MAISKEASITAEDVRFKFEIELATGRLLYRSGFGSRKAGEEAGRTKDNGYRWISINGYCCAAHRLVWLYVTGEWPDGDIDHINGIRTDNRFENLRSCSRAENLQNSARRSDNTSGHKGVSWHSRRGKWIARIWVNGRQITLGYFDDLAEAAAAYTAAKSEHHRFNPTDRSPPVLSS